MQLKHKYTRKRLTVVCVHLKAYHEFEQKRYEQTNFILNTLKEHLKCNQEEINKQSVIICGDFNGFSNEKFYKLIMSDSKLKLNDIDYSYKKSQVDFLFYTKHNNTLKLVNYLERIEVNDSLPNLNYPSDHLSLVCDFRFIQ